MDFYDKDCYSIDDIEDFINNEVEENVHLDYKASGALDKEDKKRTEITKDVSAFANSDGGIIVYGVSEEDHRPKGISPIDGRVYTKEWLENVIQLIQPRIDNLKIYPVRINDLEQSIYVVKIPRSGNAPHMARDKRYYKRFNFKSEPMEDYEVKDLYNRSVTYDLVITGCSFYKVEETEDRITYELIANVANVGHHACESFKLNYYINNYRYCDIGNEVFGEKLIYTAMNEHRVKFSRPSRETLYPEEEINMGCLQFFVKKENATRFLEGLVLDMILFYPGGCKDLAYIPSKREFVSGRENINKVLEEMNNKEV